MIKPKENTKGGHQEENQRRKPKAQTKGEKQRRKPKEETKGKKPKENTT